MAVIVCVDLDPLLLAMVRRVRPDDEVVELTADEVATGGAGRAAGMVVAAGSEAVATVRGTPVADRTVVVGDEGQRIPPTHPGPVLQRPVDAGDLRAVLGRVVPVSGRWPGLRARTRTLSSGIAPEGIFAILRAAAATAAVILESTQPDSAVPVGLVLAVVGWAVLRVWARDLTVGLVTLDAMVAAAALVATGGTGSAFLLAVGVVGAEVGWAYPARTGALVVGAASLAGVVSLALDWRAGEAQAIDMITWGTMIPLASVAGVMGWRIHQSRHGDRLAALQDLHATLDRLARQARGTAAGTLEESAIVDRTLRVLHEDVGARAAVVVLDGADAGLLRAVAGSFGLLGAPPPRLVVEPWDERRVPADLAGLLPDGDRLVMELTTGGSRRGSLVVVMPAGERSRSAAREVQRLASETAVALDNAQLFEGIRELTADTERRRLARDLHDGVVQSLVHVGFELDLLSHAVDHGAQHEVQRLRRVVGHTVDEVRATVNGLRSVRLSDGLGPALAAVGREFRSADLAVDVAADPVDGLAPEAELQLLRIAQEALSNAVQHGRPTCVRVRLWGGNGLVHLQVVDDGVGMPDGVHRAALERGVGLRAMKERADLLGADLLLQPGAEGGTEVRVDVPTGRSHRE